MPKKTMKCVHKTCLYCNKLHPSFIANFKLLRTHEHIKELTHFISVDICEMTFLNERFKTVDAKELKCWIETFTIPKSQLLSNNNAMNFPWKTICSSSQNSISNRSAFLLQVVASSSSRMEARSNKRLMESFDSEF